MFVIKVTTANGYYFKTKNENISLAQVLILAETDRATAEKLLRAKPDTLIEIPTGTFDEGTTTTATTAKTAKTATK